MEIPRHWRLKAQRYRLEGSFCPVCGQFAFPPHPVCPYIHTHPVMISDNGIPVLPPAKIETDTALMKVR